MSAFHYENGQLYAEDIALSSIADEYGTPCYVYSKAALEAAFLAYRNALSDFDAMVCYAVKANSNLAVLQTLARLGAGFDIVSGGELERVLAAGGKASRIIFSGVGKSREEIQRALDVGIHCFNVESEAELELLNEVALTMDTRARISLRVNPDVDANTHPYISTGLKDNKFGIEISRASSVYQHANTLKGISIVGVDCHIGSQLTSLAPFIDALQRVLNLIDELQALDIPIQHLDLGGGLGVSYKNETPPTPGDYVEAIAPLLRNTGLKLIMEPGRSVCANAGVLLTRVQYLKTNAGKHFAIVDAAMNDLIRPALYQAWMDIVPVNQDSDQNPQAYDVVGPVCESSDFLGKDRQLALQAGDLLAVKSAGAYSFVMSSNYNTRNRPPEIMVDAAQVFLTRRRETYQDQMALEQILP